MCKRAYISNHFSNSNKLKNYLRKAITENDLSFLPNKTKSIPDDVVRKEITKLGFERLTKMDTENTIKLIDILSKY